MITAIAIGAPWLGAMQAASPTGKHLDEFLPTRVRLSLYHWSLDRVHLDSILDSLRGVARRYGTAKTMITAIAIGEPGLGALPAASPNGKHLGELLPARVRLSLYPWSLDRMHLDHILDRSVARRYGTAKTMITAIAIGAPRLGALPAASPNGKHLGELLPARVRLSPYPWSLDRMHLDHILDRSVARRYGTAKTMITAIAIGAPGLGALLSAASTGKHLDNILDRFMVWLDGMGLGRR